MRLYESTRGPFSILLKAMLCALLFSACSSVSDLMLIDKTSQGAVYLERLSTRGATAMYSGPLQSFQATQPVLLPSPTIARVLSGLQVTLPQEVGQSQPAPLLSSEEVAFLTPLVGKALAQADKDQRVRFYLGPAGEGTAGLLFVDRPFMHVTLTRYRTTGLENGSGVTLSFSPEAALRTVEVPQSWLNIERDRPRVTVDFAFLATLPVPPTATVDTGPSHATLPAPRMW